MGFGESGCTAVFFEGRGGILEDSSLLDCLKGWRQFGMELVCDELRE